MNHFVVFVLVVLLKVTTSSYGALRGNFMKKHGVAELGKQDDNSINVDFDCKPLTSPELPNSVHQLMPGDIKVVGALGDSQTAANGAKANYFPQVTIQYRGVAALIGGDENLDTVTTLPNIFRKFNEKVYGFSTGTGDYDEPNSKFNVAIPGAKSPGMADQAQDLVNRVLDDGNVDYENDWKLVSIFIGGNDLCAWCNDKQTYDPVQYVGNIEKAINVLEQMPRTFVNVIGILNVYQVGNVTSVKCDTLHRTMCSCGVGDQEQIAELTKITKEYQRLLEESITSGQFDNREDFTVVYQPFLHDTDLPELPDGTVDHSYFSPDCFHFSEKAHAALTIALWNNMIQPVGDKDIVWDPEKIRCPSEESPYLFTNVNSKSSGHRNSISSVDRDSKSNVGKDYIAECANCNGNFDPQDSVPTSVIVLGVVGGTVFILIAIILSVRYTRRRKSSPSERLLLLDN